MGMNDFVKIREVNYQMQCMMHVIDTNSVPTPHGPQIPLGVKFEN